MIQFTHRDDFQELTEVAAFLQHLKQPFSGASVSLRHQCMDMFEDSRAALTLVNKQGSSTAWLSDLERGLRVDSLSADMEQYLLSTSRVDGGQPELSQEVFLHAAFPARAVIYHIDEVVLSLGSTEKGKRLLAEAFPGILVQADFAVGLRAQAKAAGFGWKAEVWAVLLPHRGLIVTGSSVSEAAERFAIIRNKCEEVLRSVDAWETTVSIIPQTQLDQKAAAEIRKRVSERIGAPVLIRWSQSDGCDPVIANRRLLVQSWSHLPSSHVVEDAVLGIGFAGSGAEETLIAQETYVLEQRMAQRAAVLGKVDWLEAAPAADPIKEGAVMRGEIALVTGAASGIGKACVQSFLARGAAVVGLDVNPEIENMLDRVDFFGIACDLTDEDAIRSALSRTVQTFGGLDMMVLNAGVFPSSQRIESLSSFEWERVMRINLDANLNLMREAHPLLKNAPRYGRVAVNASRNALAPGPGAAAYSVSKMALTQLARVAALEWAGEGIRINMVHPDMVFDTGVWSDEVLQSRAANYHMTVEQYKRRNLLKTELNSHDVSELIVEMCGPLFSKITGAQLPVDGGNDRVI